MVKAPGNKNNLHVEPRGGHNQREMGVIIIIYRRPPPLRFFRTTSSWTVKINVAGSELILSEVGINLKESSPCFRISEVVLSCERVEDD